MAAKKNLKRLLSTILILGLSLIAVKPYSVLADTSTARIYGTDKYQTAVAVSRAGWPDGADTAILAYGENYPDALCATPLATKYKAPVLLTGKQALNVDTAAELTRLRVKQVYIVGGVAVVSENVESKLKQMGIKVTRYSGIDMYETSVKVAKAVGTANGFMVTSGDDFADAVSIAPVAAQKGMPVVLIPKDKFTKALTDFFKSMKKNKSYLIGNPSEFSDEVLNQLPNLQTVTGSNRYERNINVLNFFSADLDLSSIYIATGRDFADALAATSLAQKKSSAVILVDKDWVPSVVQRFLASKVINNITIIGGYGAITNATERQLAEAPPTLTYLYSVNVEAFDNEKYEIPSTVTALRSDGQREEVPVTWELSSLKFKPGVYNFEGSVPGTSQKAKLILTVKPSIASLVPATGYVYSNSEYMLPKTVYANLTDGTGADVPVTWNSPDLSTFKPGIYTITGKVAGSNSPAQLKLTVRPAILSLQNLTASTYMGNSDYVLPDKVRVNLVDGTSEDVSVTWNMTGVDISKVGVYPALGIIEGTPLLADLQFKVKPEIKSLQQATASVYSNTDGKYTLPEKVTATLADGTTEEVKVSWNTVGLVVSRPGTYDLTGKVQGTSLIPQLRVDVKYSIVAIQQSYAYIYSNSSYTLPDKVWINLANGTWEYVPVTWDTSKLITTKPGVFDLTGTVDQSSISAKIKVTVY